MIAIERRLLATDNQYGLFFPDVDRIGKHILCCFITAINHTRRGQNELIFCLSIDEGEHWKEVLRLSSENGYSWNSPRMAISKLDNLFVVIVDELPLVKSFPDFNSMYDNNSCRIRLLSLVPKNSGIEILKNEHIDERGICPSISFNDKNTRYISISKFDLSKNKFVVDIKSDELTENNNTIEDESCSLTEGEIIFSSLGVPVVIMRSDNWRRQGKRSYLDSGSWTKPDYFILPAGCHRPNLFRLIDGRYFSSFRPYFGGGANQNTMMALISPHSLFSPPCYQNMLFAPLDHCENVSGDQGYTGACQLDDGNIIVVNYMNPNSNKTNIYFYKFGLHVFGNG